MSASSAPSSGPAPSDLKIEFDLSHFCRSTAAILSVNEGQVAKAVDLLDDGNTIPFIARYRKEATNGLNEIHLRTIEDQMASAKELAERKSTILRTIHEQGLLTESLRKQIVACGDRRTLEELYLPYRPRKRTRATIARENGLQPLAEILLSQKKTGASRSELLRKFFNENVADETAALQGACDILAEGWSEDAGIRKVVMEHAERAELACSAKRGKADPESRFATFFDSREKIARLPSHRFLAMQRGVDEGVLRLNLALDEDQVVGRLKTRIITNPGFEFREALEGAVEDCFARLLQTSIESSVLQKLKEKADADAIAVFSQNLRQLLMAPPAGSRVTLGLDPGFRTGCKLAVVDESGKYLTSATIFPTPPVNDVRKAETTLLELIRKYSINLIAIGNGTASREADQFVAGVLSRNGLSVTRAMVSEAGASVYSASELAIEEYPDLDVTVRGAISIAHRLQDPLAELVRIDPRSIGVGQYQHDVDQTQLRKALDREVESCVNSVGVDLNTASTSLLSYVAGIGPTLARRIVAHRDEIGPFVSREQLLKVPRLGRKAFEQAAGFLRIRNSPEPLDNTAVHPEQYGIVHRIAKHLRMDVREITGNETVLAAVVPETFAAPDCGAVTVRDVIEELKRPGRDPRKSFSTVQFEESVQTIEDLHPGMTLQAVITNVTRFGAFADIGVHQDGLIHVSQLADRFVQDPSEEVAVGDIVTVTVLEVDAARKRISLSRRQKPLRTE
ncbi:MAG: Tex family protein [Planctomyces sp.]